MNKESQDFCQNIIQEMVTTMRKKMMSKENWEHIKPHYSSVMTSIISSLVATLVIGWADSVVDSKDEHEEAFQFMMHRIAEKVIWVYSVHNQDEHNSEVH